MNQINFEQFMKRADGYEKEAGKVAGRDPIGAISKLYTAKNIYAMIMDINDSRFRREVAYKGFSKVQKKCWDLTIYTKKKVNYSVKNDLSWLDNCKIKPLFGFEEVFGLDDVKAKFMAHYGHRNNGLCLKRKPNMILYGEPGCGKTHIIKALAKEVEPVPIYNIKIGDILSKYYGESSKIISMLFRKLKGEKAVLFIDEIDAIGGSRDNGSEASNRALNTMLGELDGIDSAEWPMVIGATNRVESIDIALRERFDNEIYVPRPCYAVRKNILENEVRKNIEGKVDVDYGKVIDMIDDGFSGRKLRSLVVKVYEKACEKGKGYIDFSDFEEVYSEMSEKSVL